MMQRRYFVLECYAAGRGVLQSHTEAVKYFKMAADRGDAGAQYNLEYAILMDLGFFSDLLMQSNSTDWLQIKDYQRHRNN